MNALHLQSAAIVKINKQLTKRAISAAIHEQGDVFAVSSEGEEIVVGSAGRGTFSPFPIYSRKYGASFLAFGHSDNDLLHGSRNSWDQTIRLLDVRTVRYRSYFSGHRSPVSDLAWHPTRDTFASGSVDGSLRLWDVRSAGATGLIHVTPGSTVKGGVVCAFDPQGTVLAVGAPRGQLRLYDVRKYDGGPFARFASPAPASSAVGHSASNPVDFTSLSFCPDGKQFAAATADGTIFLHDAFSGAVHHILDARTSLNEGPPAGAPFSPGYTADGAFISAGSADGFVHHWSTTTGAEVATWRSHAGHVGSVVWSNKYQVAVTVDQNVALWLPTLDENGEPVPQADQQVRLPGDGGDGDDDDDLPDSSATTFAHAVDDDSSDDHSMGVLPSAAVDEASMSHSDMSN